MDANPQVDIGQLSRRGIADRDAQDRPWRRIEPRALPVGGGPGLAQIAVTFEVEVKGIGVRNRQRGRYRTREERTLN